MKKLFILFWVMIFTVSLCACGEANGSDEQGKIEESSSEILQMNTTKLQDTIEQKTESTENYLEDTTPITLTIGDMVLSGYLNNSVPAQSLIAQLPLTVTLNDSDNDFCGDNLVIEYSENDVQSGYKNGDLAFWTPASNFVIFVDDEENSENTGNLVILGKITEPQETLDALEGTIDVTIALKEDNNDMEEVNKTVPDMVENTDNSSINENVEKDMIDSETEESEVKIKITVGDTELMATLENNATTKAIIEQMPMTLPMMDLYGREMCYRYGAYAFPTDNLRDDGYTVGDIAYWAPGGSLVILYEQNGEEFERQHLGHINSGVEVFKTTGDTDVTFELVK